MAFENHYGIHTGRDVPDQNSLYTRQKKVFLFNDSDFISPVKTSQ
jgi:hypothetical protein